MSEVSGTVTRGKGNLKVIVEIKGKLEKPEQWEEFKTCLTTCLKRFEKDVKYTIKGPPPK